MTPTTKTTTTNHTPGPWIAEHPDNRGWQSIRSPHRAVAVAEVLWNPEREANARLIAEAPNLLHVAEGFVATLATMDRSYRPEDIFALLDKWADVARAAIAKAEGGAR
jgi:hypothetical protein